MRKYTRSVYIIYIYNLIDIYLLLLFSILFKVAFLSCCCFGDLPSLLLSLFFTVWVIFDILVYIFSILGNFYLAEKINAIPVSFYVAQTWQATFQINWRVTEILQFYSKGLPQAEILNLEIFGTLNNGVSWSSSD